MKPLLLRFCLDGTVLMQHEQSWHPLVDFEWQSGYCFPSDNPQEHSLITRLCLHVPNIEITTDHVGAYPLYRASAANGELVIGSAAWDVARTAGLNEIDAGAAFELLQFEYVLGDRTLVAGLSELTAACLWQIKWTGSGWTINSTRLWRLTRNNDLREISFDHDQQLAAENLRSQIEPIIETAQDAPKPLALNLSGGWDSRALLGCLYPLGDKHLFTCSYGNPSFNGVRIAKCLSAELHIPNKFAAFEDGEHLKYDFDALISAMAPTTRFNLADGGLLVSRQFYPGAFAACTGHSGDMFTSLPGSVMDVDIGTPENQKRFLMKNAAGAWPEQVLESLLKTSSRHLAQHGYHALGASVAESFQPGLGGYFRWKLENRIRRGVVAELRVLQAHTETIYLPMLQRAFLEYWISRSPDRLRNQILYRQMLASRIFTGKAEPLRKLPREGGGLLTATGRWGTAREQLRKKKNAISRRAFPSLSSTATMADPTAFWWRENHKLRQFTLETISQSEFLDQHFQMGNLLSYLEADNRMSPWFARIGIWNMLTLAGVESHLETS